MTGNKCENCGSTNLTTSYSGIIIMIKPESSELAKLLGIEKPGKYAIKVE
ncbi:MAG: transcription elongation factor subunit Spt4 [Nitrososphaerota archaeon]|nr:transcription elongation factor subunit Spt4 [Nitrososphaerota archaeon]